MTNPAYQHRCHISEMSMDELREQARLGRYLMPSTFDEAAFWENALKEQDAIRIHALGLSPFGGSLSAFSFLPAPPSKKEGE